MSVERHELLQEDVGAYLLGALEELERDQHLTLYRPAKK